MKLFIVEVIAFKTMEVMAVDEDQAEEYAYEDAFQEGGSWNLEIESVKEKKK